jgi:hypothetical protein
MGIDHLKPTYLSSRKVHVKVYITKNRHSFHGNIFTTNTVRSFFDES